MERLDAGARKVRVTFSQRRGIDRHLSARVELREVGQLLRSIDAFEATPVIQTALRVVPLFSYL
jgi:hypothetical protein